MQWCGLNESEKHSHRRRPNVSGDQEVYPKRGGGGGVEKSAVRKGGEDSEECPIFCRGMRKSLRPEKGNQQEE